MRILILVVLGLFFTTSAFASETTDKRLICSIKDFEVILDGEKWWPDADKVGLSEKPKELIIPKNAVKNEQTNTISWDAQADASVGYVKNVYLPNKQIWVLAYSYYTPNGDSIVSVNASRLCDEF